MKTAIEIFQDKGIDDSLAAKHSPQLIYGEEADMEVENTYRKACEADPPRTRADLELIPGGQVTVKKDKKGRCVLPSLVVDNGGYAKYVGKGDRIETERISNFTITVNERLTMPNGEEMINAQVCIVETAPRQQLFSYRDFRSSRDFKTALKTSEAIWSGKDSDLPSLQNTLLQQNASKCKGVEILGRHDDLIVLPKVVIDKNGPVENPPIKLVDFYDTNLFKFVPSKWPSREEHLEAAKSIFSYLPRINEAAITGAVIGWTFVLPWCNSIRNTPGWGGFPPLNPWGQAGSGKTDLSKTILRFNGIPWSFEPCTLPKTKFTRIKGYASTNLIPVLMDEYRSSSIVKFELSRIHEEIRSNYSGLQDERGKANLESKAYPLCSPIILAGEDRPRDTTALEERLLCINPKKETISGQTPIYGAECNKAYKSLHRAPLEAFALPFWSWCLSYEDWLSDLEKARTAIIQWKEKNGFEMPNRIVNNLSILFFGWCVFLYYANHLNIKPSLFLNGETMYKAIESAYFEVIPGGKQVNELDDLLIFVSLMVSNGELKNGIHWIIKDNNILLRLNIILPLAYEYARRTDRRRELLGEDAYRSLIANSAGKPGSYIISTTERGYFYSHDGGRTQFRGIYINPRILEEKAGIEAAIWQPGEKAEHGQWNIY